MKERWEELVPAGDGPGSWVIIHNPTEEDRARCGRRFMESLHAVSLSMARKSGVDPMKDTPSGFAVLRHAYSGERVKAAVFFTEAGLPLYSFRETVKAGAWCDRTGRPVPPDPHPFGEILAPADWKKTKGGSPCRT